MTSIQRGVFLLALLFSVSLAHAASVSTVSVTSATAGTQVVNRIGGGVTVMVPISAAASVWIARLDGTCSTDLVTQHGFLLAAGDGYEFDPQIDRWTGQLCAILDTGVTAVAVEVNAW